MKILLVDDEKRVGEGMRRRLSRLRSDWEVKLAPSADEAVQKLVVWPVDAIISDLRMPGRDGAELLEEVEATFPDALRIALTGHAEHSLALRATLHSHRLLTKPCDAGELASIVEEGVLLLRRLEDDALRHFVSSMDQLPQPSDRLQEVLHKIRDPNVELSDFQRLLESEPALAVVVMRIANTAYFGGGRIGNLFEAVQSLGLSVVQALLVGELARRSICLPHSCMPVLSRIVESGQEVMSRCLQLHRRFYSKDFDRASAITACLLQDIGKLLFLSCRPLVYRDIVAESDRTHQDVIDLERKHFGCDHSQLGALLLKFWGLPEPIVTAVALHHESKYASTNPSTLAGLLFFGGQCYLNHSEKTDHFFMKQQSAHAIFQWVPNMAEAIGVTSS